MITAKNLTKRYGDAFALDNVNFTIDAGESVALWGANGAGKTTTIRCLLGVHSFEGELTVNDINVRQNSKNARRMMGYVPQEATFYDMSVLETLAFYARLKKAPLTRIDEVLAQVQLAEHSRKRVNALSGGMKQRLALAVALLSDPPILILDEPTANLDVAAQQDFIHQIQSLNRQGKTIIFSSHRFDEVMALASRVLVLDKGKLILECPPPALIEKLGLQRWMRLWIPQEQRDTALQVLQSQGYAYRPNGHTVYVRIGDAGKVAPLRALESAQITIEDFDLLDGELVPPEEA